MEVLQEAPGMDQVLVPGLGPAPVLGLGQAQGQVQVRESPTEKSLEGEKGFGRNSFLHMEIGELGEPGHRGEEAREVFQDMLRIPSLPILRRRVRRGTREKFSSGLRSFQTAALGRSK